MTIAKAIARAWTDDHYKAKLLSDPRSALTDVGIDVPAGTTMNVIENTTDTRHLVLAAAPINASELSTEELALIAGGLYGIDTAAARTGS